MFSISLFLLSVTASFISFFESFIATKILQNCEISVSAVGSSVSSLSGLYTTAMKAAGASRRVFQLLDRVSSMPTAGDKCPIGSVTLHPRPLSLGVPFPLFYTP